MPREWLAVEGLSFTMTRRVRRSLKSVIPSRVCHEVLVNLTCQKRLSFVHYVLVESISIFRFIRKIKDKR